MKILERTNETTAKGKLLSLIAVSSALVLSDVGTYEAPNHPAVGVQSVVVNDVPVVAGGKLVADGAPGQPIRRQ